MNGDDAALTPRSATASSSSSARTISEPFGDATYTTILPSGEIVTLRKKPLRVNGWPEGGTTLKRIRSGVAAGVRISAHDAAPAMAIAASAAIPSATRLCEERGGAAGTVCVSSRTSVRAALSSSSRRTRPICGRRFCGSFCRHRRSSVRTCGGVSAGNVVQSGSRVRMCATASEIVSPGSNVCLPVSISNRTQPNDQMSVRRSTGLPRACSGLMYAAVPRMTPPCVA